jgi:hypothetical protein
VVGLLQLGPAVHRLAHRRLVVLLLVARPGLSFGVGPAVRAAYNADSRGNLTPRGAPMAKAKGGGQPNGGENTSAYFRKVFKESPKLLKTRSNEEVLKRWLADHPGEKEVPAQVRNSLMNVKSALRKRGRKRGQRREEARVRAGGEPATEKKLAGGLESLEEHIDECLTVAKVLDRQGLDHVIRLLRQARNEVVWKIGQ